jgi:uncharacterized protein (DUF2236 family)
MARKPVFPSDEEIDQIILGPDALIWQRFSDIRLFLAAGYALLLQVAHPTVGSGVRDHSDFAEDPWGRLLRTVDYLNLIVYGGPEAAAVGRRLRDMHKAIRGSNPDGSRYSALEPEAYAWVHATLIDGAIRAHRRFIGPLSRAELDRFYAEYLPLGRLLGVREGDLAQTWEGHCEYVDTMIAERLGDNETVQKVIRTMKSPGEPPPGLPIAPLWPLLRVPPSRVLWISTFGLLQPALRRRFGIRWKRGNQVELRALGAASRASGPLLPATLKNMGPAYLRWRADEIARGPLGPGGASSGLQPAPVERPVVRVG